MSILINRDASWLYFNGRVLQEAADERVPLYERIKFLAIYSSNLDEFYRVRVSRLRAYKTLRKRERKELLDFKPKQELREIRTLVAEQQAEFGRIFRYEILPGLAREGIHLIHAHEMDRTQRAAAKAYFDEQIVPLLKIETLHADKPMPWLENRQLYLAVCTEERTARGEHLIINIPSNKLDRFFVLPEAAAEPGYYVCFIDSIIRANLEEYLGEEVTGAYAIKLSRDAELYIDNEFDGDLLRKIETGLEERDKGLPTRFLYDGAAPKNLRKLLKEKLTLSKYDLIPGARYHNFMDFFGFPLPEGREDLVYPDLTPLPHPQLEGTDSIMHLMRQSDILLHFPYQKYDYVPQLVHEAAHDPAVRRISITLYRVAKKSAVVKELLYARKHGKEVNVFVEAKARFDEESNLFWGKELEKAGAAVRYSYPGVKVHTKLLLITRHDEDLDDDFHYSYIGTGNFNEKTALLYGDHTLLTTHQGIGADIESVFELLAGNLILPRTKYLLVAPFTLANELNDLIDAEIKLAKAGKKDAYLFFKMNSLEDDGMIEKIQRAAAAGVRVRLIVRGICRLLPEPGDNIEIISLVDRFLEHARIYLFGNGGEEKVFMGSADLMERNLHRRVEVVTPILDAAHKLELRRIMDIQWRDNSRARTIDHRMKNSYRISEEGTEWRAQYDVYEYLQGK